MTDYLALDQCVERGVYQIKSRNLLVGVYDGKGGFVGIREKFKSRYLFTEIAWEEPHNGTVWPVAFIEMLPEGIDIRERSDEPTRCSDHQRECRWSGPPAPAPWVHIDDGTPLADDDSPVGPGTYKPLFDYLTPIDQRLNDEWREKYGR